MATELHKQYPELRSCPVCGRSVHLTRRGEYRRHFAESDGRLRLCGAVGQDALTTQERRCAERGVVRLLDVEPTQEQRHSHVLRLMHLT